MGALVTGVDHVYIPMLGAADAFRALSERLDLPVMWPFSSFGEFSSGGVSLGSIKLEILAANPTTPWSSAHDPPRIQAVAFTPSDHVDDAYLAELDRRALRHAPPEHFTRDGRPGWTNVYFVGLISPSAGAFVCDYLTPEPRDLERRRRVLVERGGGRLGIVDTVAVVIASPDVERARDRWLPLLGPAAPGHPCRWQLPIGPALVLTAGDEDRVDSLVVAVRAPEHAARLLREVEAEGLGQLPVRFVPAT